MQPDDETSKRWWREALEACGLELTPERLAGIEGDIDAVLRNIARIEALDPGSEDPAITLSSPSRA